MSAQLPDAPKPQTDQVVGKPVTLGDRLITLSGLLIFLAGLVIARVLEVPPGQPGDAELGADLGDIFKSFGIVVASLGGALPVPDALRRLLGAGGSKVVAVLVAGGVLAAGSILPGCALLERREIHTDTAPEVTYGVEDGRCVLRGFTDGTETYTAIGPVGEPCPAVTVRP